MARDGVGKHCNASASGFVLSSWAVGGQFFWSLYFLFSGLAMSPCFCLLVVEQQRGDPQPQQRRLCSDS
eukprot:3731066-Alexandrium_andersonii.AAC.1